jgi:hypothetical protein
MTEPPPQVVAARRLLQEVCTLLAPFRDDTVLIGGWVPEIRFPDATPAHVGSIDVDFALRAGRERHAQVIALLLQNGFRQGTEPYQFVKNLEIAGRSFPVRLDLLTSRRHHAEIFEGSPAAPFPVGGAEYALLHYSLESIGSTEVRVASVVPFLIMKAHAILGRDKPKDAYDLHFCLENFPGGIPALVVEFAGLIDDPDVRDVLSRLAGRFRDENDAGPCAVVEVEGQMGDARAIRKLAVFTQVDDFLRALRIRP